MKIQKKKKKTPKSIKTKKKKKSINSHEFQGPPHSIDLKSPQSL